ncbi:MAG: sugar-binding domain-containing protein, partial [Anaerolineales bacterium]
MLYPINNPYRQFIELNGFWDFKMDPNGQGESQGWPTGFTSGRPIAVPASWNDQFEESRDFLGPAWYQRRFTLPWGWDDKRIHLRFNSVNYLAQVWLNGKMLGIHEGGHLPFTFDITDAISTKENILIVRVDGQLAQDRVPPGNITGSELDFFSSHGNNFPQAQFDFFPYCGIHRPVLLYVQPHAAIEDMTVLTELNGNWGSVEVHIEPAEPSVRVTLSDPDHA